MRHERVAEVRRRLGNYQKLKQAIKDICELDHELLRPEPQALGVKRVCIPNRLSRSPQRKRQQKMRWFRDGQK